VGKTMKLMQVETKERKLVVVMAGVDHPFDVVDGHLIFFNYLGYPESSFAPGEWLSVVDGYPDKQPNEGE